VRLKGVEFGAIASVPDADLVVVASRGDLRTVGRNRHGGDYGRTPLVLFETRQLEHQPLGRRGRQRSAYPER
jgi:hypothetical protein